jgi:hypothetical protein
MDSSVSQEVATCRSISRVDPLCQHTEDVERLPPQHHLQMVIKRVHKPEVNLTIIACLKIGIDRSRERPFLKVREHGFAITELDCDARLLL